MKREIKLKFIIDNKHVSRAYTIEEIMSMCGSEKIFEDMEECVCSFNESVNHCECGSVFDNSEITDKIRFTGLTDKNGKEIYEGDLLRVKHKIGDNENHYVDSVYSVGNLKFDGLEFNFLKIYNDNKDNNCQFPISTTLSFKYNSLTTDYRNKNYNSPAINDTHGENHLLHTRWVENHYSNDIVVIGNIYENPDLI